MTEETFEQGGTMGHAPGFAPDRPANLGKIVRREVGEPPILEMTPDLLLRLQLRRVRRQPDHVPVAMGREVATYLPVPVRIPAVPQQHERPAEMAPEMPEEFEDVRAADILAGMESQVEGDAPAARRHDECADRRDLLVRAGPDRQQRGLAPQRPCAAEQRGHQKPRFVQADQARAESGQFFLARAQSCWIHNRTRWSARSLAVRWGRCGVNPQARRSRPT